MAAIFAKKAIAAFLAAGLGIGAFVLIQVFTGDWMNAELVGTCTPQSNNKYLGLLGIKGVDEFLCIIVQFFFASIKNHSGLVLYFLFLPFANVMFALMTLEGSRSGSWPVFGAVVALIGQLLGISVAFPLLWLPAYFFSGERSNYFSVYRVGFTSVMLFICCLPSLAVGLSSNQFNILWAIVIFQIAPVIPGFLTTLVPHFAADSTRYPNQFQTVVAVYYLFGGMGFAFYAMAIIRVLDDPSVVGTILEVFQAPSGVQFAELFLWIDFAVMFVAALMFIAWEAGLGQVLKFVVVSVVASPAVAFALFAVDREKNLLLVAVRKGAKRVKGE